MRLFYADAQIPHTLFPVKFIFVTLRSVGIVRSSGGRCAPRPRLLRFPDSSGTKTCTVTNVQVLFSNLLNFNFDGRPASAFYTVHSVPMRQTPRRKTVLFCKVPSLWCILWLFNGRNSDIRFGFFALLFIPRFQPIVRNPFRTLPPIKILLSGI